jgi:hypothetical protein
MQKLPDPNDLLKDVILNCEKKKPSRSVLSKYRTVIIFLKIIHHYTYKEICEYLTNKKIKTSLPGIAAYIKRNPITNEEVKYAEENYDNIKKEAIQERNKKLADKLRGKNT